MEKKYITSMVSTHGNLSKEIKGTDREEKWSDLWYIFQPLGFEKTLAEMDTDERENRRSIDGSYSALENFAKWYQSEQTE